MLRGIVGLILLLAVVHFLAGCTVNFIRPPAPPAPAVTPNLLKNPCANLACNETRRIA